MFTRRNVLCLLACLSAVRPKFPTEQLQFGDRFYDRDQLLAAADLSQLSHAVSERSPDVVAAASQLQALPADDIRQLVSIVECCWEVAQSGFTETNQTIAWSRSHAVGDSIRYRCHFTDCERVGRLWSRAFDCGQFGPMVCIVDGDRCPREAVADPACFPLCSVLGKAV